MHWRLSPSQTLIVAVALGFAAALSGIWLIMHQPWLGVQFQRPSAGGELTVARVYANSPAAGHLHAGDVIAAVIDEHGVRLPVDAGTVVEDPFALDSWAAMDAHLRLSGRLHTALQGGHVDLELGDGTQIRVQPHASVPLRAIPGTVWLILVASLLAYSICLSVWTYRPRDGAAQALGLCGTGVLLTFISVIDIDYRPWVLAEPVYRALLDGNLLTLALAGYTFLAVFWYYPTPPHRFPFMAAALLLGILAAVVCLARLVPVPGQVMLPFVLAYTLLPIPLGIVQWRRTRHRPLERAALKWLYLVTAVAGGFIAVTNNFPIALGQPPLVSNAPVVLGMAMLFGGFALGIVRYRLFNLDRWWFEAWVWALGGVLVIALDALLLWLNTGFGVALGVALALAGWVWFPMRQWLWRRLSPAGRQTVERHLPRLIDTLFSAGTAAELQRNWHTLLRDIYAPLHLAAVARQLDRPTLGQDGLVLRVPGLVHGESIDLQYGHKGQRLFNTADEQLAGSLLDLARQAAQARRARDEHEARQQAQQREKELLVQDLHDGLGGAVTNIGLLAEMGCKQQDVGAAHKALRAIAGLARDSVSEIRGFMTTIEDTDADWQDVAADLRLCAHGMLEPYAIEKEFTASVDEHAPPPDTMLRMNLFRAFKETLNNIVKHARARRVGIELRVEPQRVRLTVSDDGAGFALEPRVPGGSGKSRGLRHLHERALALGGELALRSSPGAGTTVTLTAPLPVKSPATGIASGGTPA